MGEMQEEPTWVLLDRALGILETMAVDTVNTIYATPGNDGRWAAIGRTQIELGILALRRSIEATRPLPIPNAWGDQPT